MPILKVHRYSRGEIQDTPHCLYVFGDNMAQVGYGGQAGAARGEPNAVGIPTLWAPGAPFKPYDLGNGMVKAAIDEAIERLRSHLAQGGMVVLPEDGVGTGIADLARNAPAILRYINAQLDTLQNRPVPLEEVVP